MDAFIGKRSKENAPSKNTETRRKKFGEDGFEAWGGYMNAKITKLEEQFEEESKNLNSSEKLSNIFEGISIFVNGYTEPSSEDLRLLMLLHGGTYHHYYRSEKTTHVIASNLPNAKMDQLKTMKVITPEWIVKSIEAGRLLDYKNFLLFSKQSVFKTENKLQHGKGNEEKNKKIYERSVYGKQQSVAKTAVDARFLSEFYSNSRLHHLSTMGAMFKQYVGELKENHNGIFPGRKRISDWFEEGKLEKMKTGISDNIVFHIDMDCFFVSVALRDHPELKGKPVAVAHARGNPTHERFGIDTKFEYKFYKKKMETKMGLADEESSCSEDSDDEGSKPWLSEFSSRSEVASCSYEARKAGVRNGMYLGSALKLCPSLKTVPYDFEGYKEVSYTLYNTVCEYTLDIEAVSCDELFIDSTSLLRDMQMKPLDFATMLRNDIRERTNCPSSIGIGSNKLQARLATKRAKPDGQFYLQPDDVITFMSGVDVYDLPGVGRTIGYKLKSLNAKTCLDLQNISLATLKKTFGEKTGESLYKHSRGIDERPVNSAYQRKSVSAEVNYGIRFVKEEEAITFLKQLSSEVSNRLKELNMKGRNITFKVMIRAKDAPAEAAKFMGHGACDYTTRSVQLPYSSNDAELISKHVISIYQNLSVPASELRGIGIQVTKLESLKQVGGALDNFLKSKRGEKKEASTSKSLKEPTNDAGKLVVPSLTQIDRSVLDSLPKELQIEILNEYSMENIRIQKSDLRWLKKTVDNAAENKSRVELTKNSSLREMSLCEMRNMIGEWVSTESKPTQCDVEMLISYVCDLIHKKQIENVDILLKCFRRYINDKNDGKQYWVDCFREVVAYVQSSMTAVFEEHQLGMPIQSAFTRTNRRSSFKKTQCQINLLGTNRRAHDLAEKTLFATECMLLFDEETNGNKEDISDSFEDDCVLV